jgi:hypothetical protein
MTRSTVDPGADGHEQVRQLLPWLLAGTLDSTELAMVHAHLATCERCRADLAWERKLRAAGQQRAPVLDPDQALSRLLPRLGPQQDRQPGRHQAGPPATGSQQTRGLPARLRRALAANDGRWLRRVALAQFGVIALLAGLLARPGADDASYHGLGGGARAEGNLVVMFRPDTPEGELRRILRASQARVVDGPTALDAYVLAVPAARTARAAQQLGAEPAVTLAQPLVFETRP